MNKLLHHARVGLAIASALAVSDCNFVLGTDDWTYEASGGAGGPAVLHAADWTDSFGAVYLFESGNIGADATANGVDLELVGIPGTDKECQEGESSAKLDGKQNGFRSQASFFQSPPNSVLTFGGWFRLDGDDQPAILRYNNDNGYSLSARDGAAECTVGQKIGEAEREFWTAQSEDSWAIGTWAHVVCRLDEKKTLTAVVNGEIRIGASVNDAEIGDEAVLEIGAGDYEGTPITFTGRADEIFFAKRGLTNPQILRIYACGIAGQRCTCDPEAPSQYSDCGRAAECTSLPACDAPLE